MEQLPMLNEVDILFLRVEPLAEGEGRDQSVHGPLKASPIWQQLGAVQNGLVVEYDAELFYASPLTASAFLDVVEQTLLA
jgi:ABC-type Fe3+-hydroxamate transport system substrate-binding protein